MQVERQGKQAQTPEQPCLQGWKASWQLWCRVAFLLCGLFWGGCTGHLPLVTMPAMFRPEVVATPLTEPLTLPEQVTNSPDDAFAPALSPDGPRLLFVSNRSGNLDIWLQILQSPTPMPAWQLTWDASTDTDPAWSPDGTRLAFTSHRSDPSGDIFIMSIPSRPPSAVTVPVVKRLTDLDTADTAPVWSPDGRWIVYTARQGPRQSENLWRLELRTGTRQQLTQAGGSHATFTPDGAYLAYTVPGPERSPLWVMRWRDGAQRQLTQGAMLDTFAAWGRDGTSLFVTRYAEDTNRDGRVTIDDNPSIWRLAVSPQLFEAGTPAAMSALQLTSSQDYSLSPTLAAHTLYFAANRLGALGIWALPLTGLITPQADVQAQIQLARSLTQRAPDDIPLQILAWQRVAQHFPHASIDVRAEAAYEAARRYRQLDRLYDGTVTLQRLWPASCPPPPAACPEVWRPLSSQGRLYTGLAAVEWLSIQAAQPGRDPQVVQQQVVQLQATYAETPQVGAAALLTQGAIALAARQTTQALEAYDQVLERYPMLPQPCAEALYRKAEIYAILQQPEAVLQTYLAVLQRFPDVRTWGLPAARAAVDLLLSQRSDTPTTARLHDLIATYQQVPILPALALRRLGDVYRQQQETALATATYQQVVENFAAETEQVHAARLALAQLAEEAGQWQRALDIYADLVQAASAEADTVRLARQGYIAAALRKAQYEQQHRDPRLALNTYARLMTFAPENLAAYRGAVALYAQLGEIAATVQRYQQAVAQQPRQSALHYALGLAYTYTEPPRFAAAEQELLIARTLDAQAVHIHQALGFVYEQQGRQMHSTPLLERALASYQIALTLNARRGDQENRANLLLNLGNVFLALDNPTLAVQHYRQRADLPVPFPHLTTELLFHLHYGIAAAQSTDAAAAQEHLRRALQLAEATQQVELQAQVWDRLGLSYQEDGNYAAAIQAFAQALALHRQQGERRNAHLSLRNLANNRFFLAQASGERLAPELLSQSLDTYYASLESVQDYTPPAARRLQPESTGLLSISTQFTLDDENTQAAQGFDRQGEIKLIFTNIGRIYEAFGDYAQARRFFRQKLDLIPSSGAAAETIPVRTEKALLFNQLGALSYHQGDLDTALQEMQASLALCQTLDNTTGMVINQANIGRIVADQAALPAATVPLSTLQQALAGQEAALALLETHPALSRRLYPVILRHNAGMLAYYAALRLPDRAPGGDAKQAVVQTLALWQQYYGYAQQALTFFGAALQHVTAMPATLPGNPARLAAILYHDQAQVWHLLQQENEAQAALQRAITLADTFYLHDVQWRLRLTLAAWHPGRELTILQEAIQVLENSPAMLALAPASAEVMAGLDHLYGRTVTLLLAAQEQEAAYIYTEHWQAQRLIAQMSSSDQLPFSRASDLALQGDVQRLVSQLRTLQTQLATPERVAAVLALPHTPVAALTAPPSAAPELPAAAQELRTSYQQTLGVYRTLLDHMRQERPELAMLFTPSVIEPVEIQELLGSGSALIKYTLLPGRLLIWAIDSAHFITQDIAVPAEQVAAILERLHHPAPALRPDDVQQLSDWFVAPLAAFLDTVTRLYILPDARLLPLPWAALRRQQVPLGETAQIGVVHSGRYWFQAWQKRSLYRERLLIASTEADAGPDAAIRWYQAAQQAVGTVTVLPDTPDSKQQFVDQVPTYDVVHLAMPLVYNVTVPLASALHFGDGQRHHSQLDVRALYGLETSANLAVVTHTMPATSQPSGPVLPTVDHGFLFAGFSTLLVHQGPGDAAYDQALLTAFYTYLKDHAVGEALQRAQRALRHQYPQRLDWAQFQLYGYLGMNADERQNFAQTQYRQVLDQAGTALQQQRWQQAATALEHAARLSILLQVPQGLPVIYQRLTEAYQHVKQYDHAIAAQNRLLALPQVQDNPAMLADVHHTLGILYSDAEHFPEAVLHLQQAAALQQAHGLTAQLNRSFITLGIAQERGAAYQEALVSFQRSLELSQELGQRENVGEQLRRLGRIALLRLNDYAAARGYFERALAIFETLGEPAPIAQVLMELGRVQQAWGSFDPAMAYFQRAAQLSQSHDDLVALAQAHIDMASTAWLRGAYQDAFEHQRQGAQLAETAGADLQKLLATNVLGLIYWTLNDSERARRSQTEALQLAQALGLKNEQATVYNNTGIIDRQEQRYDAAIDAFTHALQLDVALASRWGQAHDQRNLGMTYLQQGDLDRAQTHLQQALRLSTAIGDRTNQAKALLSLGDTAAQRQAWPEAQGFYDQALSGAQTLGVPEVTWRALYGLGQVWQAQGQPERALEAWRQAIDVVENLRAAIKVEEFRNGFSVDKLDLYEAVIFLLLDQGQGRDAFHYMERARGRSFIDLLGNQRLNLRHAVSQDLLASYDVLRDRLQQLQQALSQASAPERPALMQELQGQRQRYEDLLITIKSAHPQLSTFVTVDPLTLADVQQLLEPGVALVEYFVGRQATVIWAFTRTDMVVQRVAMTRPALRQQVQDYRQRLTQRVPVLTAAQALYDLLLRPVAPLLASVQYLGIIPHDSLHYLAFASLHDGQRYLIDAQALFYAPSASVLRFTFSRRRPQPMQSTAVLAIGNPDLGNLNYDLPLAEREAQSLRWPFPKVTVLTRDQALESWLVQHIAQYSIIHIAAHGEFDSINPLFSALKFTRDQQADGNLEVSEIFGLDIQADLVTLSACQTGLGAVGAGDELVGMNRAFIYAGTHAIISSLWRIDDLASAVLMKHFYRFYTQANKAESLRQAQHTVRQQFPHPLYWAGFSLAGDYR